MATFKVGDAVRVVDDQSDFYGQETIILKLDVEGIDGWERYVGHQVAIRLHPTWHGTDGFAIFEPHELEPIQRSGNQTIPWSECLWQPTQQEETA